MKIYPVILVLTLICSIFLQPEVLGQKRYSILADIYQLSDGNVYLASVFGDEISVLDSAMSVNGKVSFQFKENTLSGMYRLIMGQTLYAKIMEQPPQMLDFLYNYENIELKSNFNSPDDSMVVLKSFENKIWFEYKLFEKNYRLDKKLIEDELWDCENMKRKQNQTSDDIFARGVKCDTYIMAYNALQKKRDSLAIAVSKKYPGSLASKLIKTYNEPIINGNLSLYERNLEFRKNYFSKTDFNQPELTRTPVFTNKVYNYIFGFAQRGLPQELQEQEFIYATDSILKKARVNDAVFMQILNYLVDGFEKLSLNKALAHIAAFYSASVCEDGNSTLSHKLRWQNMAVGTKVPDILLGYQNLKQITLKSTLKNKNLLVFWSSECPHCNHVLPEVVRLTNGIDPEEYRIITIALDKNNEQWENKIKELKIGNFFNFCDLKGWEGEAARSFNIYATPTFLLIDNNLTILAKPKSLQELARLISG